MIANKLNYIIRFEKKTISQDSYGNVKEKWEFLKDKFASILKNSSRNNYESEGRQVTYTTTFYIRYDSDIDYNCRILYNGSYYIIMNIEEDGRKEALRLVTERWLDADEKIFDNNE